MKEMKQYTIAEVCSRLSSGKGIPASKVTPTGQDPVIGGNGIRGYTDSFNFDGECAVIGRQGANCGNVRYFQGKAYMTEHAIVAIGNEKANTKYLACLFSLMHLGNLSAQSAQPGLSVQTLSKQIVNLPHISTQNQIADIIRSLDTKIELNKYINDNLEQQASSLLSDWISTYPCRTYKLSDICKYANAKCETGNLTPQNYISTENMLPNKKGIVEASNIPTGKATCYKVDDILIANIRPYFQKIWKADINGGCSADVLCIRANIESHSPILYWLLHQDAFFEYVMTGAKGCKMPRGDKQHIMNWSIDLPEVQYWADLATQLGSIDQQIAYNRIESINLSNLRDTLLPKLMSGEIKINEIDC